MTMFIHSITLTSKKYRIKSAKLTVLKETNKSFKVSSLDMNDNITEKLIKKEKIEQLLENEKINHPFLFSAYYYSFRPLNDEIKQKLESYVRDKYAVLSDEVLYMHVNMSEPVEIIKNY